MRRKVGLFGEGQRACPTAAELRGGTSIDFLYSLTAWRRTSSSGESMLRPRWFILRLMRCEPVFAASFRSRSRSAGPDSPSVVVFRSMTRMSNSSSKTRGRSNSAIWSELGRRATWEPNDDVVMPTSRASGLSWRGLGVSVGSGALGLSEQAPTRPASGTARKTLEYASARGHTRHSLLSIRFRLLGSNTQGLSWRALRYFAPLRETLFHVVVEDLNEVRDNRITL